MSAADIEREEMGTAPVALSDQSALHCPCCAVGRVVTQYGKHIRPRGDERNAIVQRDESCQISCWIHAVLHKIEGDAANSRYWYREAGQFYESYTDPQAELKTIKATLTY